MSKAEKRRMNRVLVALALLALAALLAALQLRGSRKLTVREEAIAPEAARDMMRVSLTYDPGTYTLRGTQTLLATNRSDSAREEIVLRLLMNGEDGQRVAVSGVTVDGQSVEASLEEGDETTLRIACDWQPGQQVTLAWTVMARHAKTADTAAVTLPVLAVCEDGAWRTDAYDALAMPGCAQAFDVSLTLIAPDSAKAVFGPALIARSWETGVGETMYTAQMRGARDVSFALRTGGALRPREVDGVLVSALGGSAAEAGRLLDGAQTALESLEEAGFAYPFASLSVAQAAEDAGDGAAYSGLVLTGGQGEALARRLTRLVARQTFGILVGVDAWNEPWLSRSLAAAAELIAYRVRRGEAAYTERYFETVDIASRLTRPAGVCVGASVDRFGSEAEMTQVLRDQGGEMLMGIEAAVGEEAFREALRTFVRENAGQIATRADLEAALLEQTGSDWSGYLADELTF